MQRKERAFLLLLYLLILPSLSAMVRFGERARPGEAQKSTAVLSAENRRQAELMSQGRFSKGTPNEEGASLQRKDTFDPQCSEMEQKPQYFYPNQIAQRSAMKDLQDVEQFNKYRQELESALSEIEIRKNEINQTSDESFTARAALYATAYTRLQVKLRHMISFLNSYPEFDSKENTRLLASSSVALIMSAYSTIDMRKVEPLKVTNFIKTSSPVDVPFRLVSLEMMDSADHEIEERIRSAEALMAVLKAIRESQGNDGHGEIGNQGPEVSLNVILQQVQEACVAAKAIKELFAKRVLSKIHELPDSFNVIEDNFFSSQKLSSLEATPEENKIMKKQLAQMQKDLDLFFHWEHERIFADKLMKAEVQRSTAVSQQIAASQQELEAMQAQATTALAAQNRSWLRRLCVSSSAIVPSAIANQVAKIKLLQAQRLQHMESVQRLWIEVQGHEQQISMVSNGIGERFSKAAATFDEEGLQEQLRLLFYKKSFCIGRDVMKSLFYFSGIPLSEIRWEKLREAITREISKT